MTPTNDPRSIQAFDGLASSVLRSAAQVTESSAKAYLDGLDTILGVQRKLLAETPLAPITPLLEAQVSLARGLLAPLTDAADAGSATRADGDDQTRALLVDAARTTRKPRAARSTTNASKARRPTATKTRRAATRRAPAAAAKQRTPSAPAPIVGYDDLTANEVNAKLRDLSQGDLATVAAYEKAHDARATVLERAKTLQEAEPSPGYDALTADEAVKLLAGANAEVAEQVGAYERRHKNRSTVLEAAQRSTASS